MSDRPRHIRIFASSPSDVEDERNELKAVVEELAPSFSGRGVTLELLRWETHSYPSLESPQVAINRQIGAYEIFIGIMWKRFGTPTDTSGSGTEEEFRTAYKLWEQDKRRPVLFYFKDTPFMPTTMEDVGQVARVLGFRQELTTARKAFVWNYPTPERPDFPSHVRPQLRKAIEDYVAALDGDQQRPDGADTAPAPPPRLPSTLFAVYVADYSGQPEYLREEILQRLCERRGAAEIIPIIDEAELKQRDPSNPTVSIHLFDGTCGDREHDLLQLGCKHTASQIVWAPRALDLSQPLNGRSTLRDLVAGDGPGPACHLTRLQARDAAEDIVARVVKFEQQWRLKHARCVLLDVNRKDTVSVKDLIDYMDSHRIQRASRPYDVHEPSDLDKFDDAIVRSRVLIFVSGRVGQDYVRRRLLSALGKVAPLQQVHKIAVYGAPPERQPRDAWRFHLPFLNVKFIDNTTGFDPAEVSELLADVMEAERHEAAS